MRVVRVQVVGAFKADERVVFSVGPRLRELEERLQGKLTLLNVLPSVPPEAPRALLRASEVAVNVCLNRFELVIQPPRNVAGDVGAAVGFVRAKAEDILQGLWDDSLEYAWCGVVAHMDFPTGAGAAAEAITPVFERMINIFRGKRKLSSFQVQFGFVDERLNRIYHVFGYENRNMQGPGKLAGEASATEVPVAESGVRVVLDLNNKPCLVKKSVVVDLQGMLGECGDLVRGLPETLNLEGLI